MRDAVDLGVTKPVARRRPGRELAPGKLALAMNTPSLLVMFLVLAYPIYYAGFLSFHKVGVGQMRRGEFPFIGLENYTDMFGDRQFWRSLQVTVYYVLLNIPIQTVLAIGIAVMMDRVTQSSIIRGIFVMPWLLPPVIVALVWLWMLDPQLGFVNNMLEAIGLNRLPFLGSPDYAMPSIALINIWQYTGYTALLFFAGLQTVPKSIYEAAAIDGANERRMFWSITLPLLRPVLVFVLVTTIIGSFQIFDTIAVTTSGGPVDATRVITWYIFEFAFQRFQMGYATAVSVVLFLILVVATLLQMRILRSDESDLA